MNKMKTVNGILVPKSTEELEAERIQFEEDKKNPMPKTDRELIEDLFLRIEDLELMAADQIGGGI